MNITCHNQRELTGYALIVLLVCLSAVSITVMAGCQDRGAGNQAMSNALPPSYEELYCNRIYSKNIYSLVDGGHVYETWTVGDVSTGWDGFVYCIRMKCMVSPCSDAHSDPLGGRFEVVDVSGARASVSVQYEFMQMVFDKSVWYVTGSSIDGDGSGLLYAVAPGVPGSPGSVVILARVRLADGSELEYPPANYTVGVYPR